MYGTQNFWRVFSSTLLESVPLIEQIFKPQLNKFQTLWHDPTPFRTGLPGIYALLECFLQSFCLLFGFEPQPLLQLCLLSYVPYPLSNSFHISSSHRCSITPFDLNQQYGKAGGQHLTLHEKIDSFPTRWFSVLYIRYNNDLEPALL